MSLNQKFSTRTTIISSINDAYFLVLIRKTHKKMFAETAKVNKFDFFFTADLLIVIK